MLAAYAPLKPLAWQLIRQASDLLADRKSLSDLRLWFTSYPGFIRPYLCDAIELAMLEEFRLLIGRPVNTYQWQKFINQLEYGTDQKSRP